MLYIFWFLHQTTTIGMQQSILGGCISFDSYIKPQPCSSRSCWFKVVYLLIPTSNHNLPLSIHVMVMLYIFWFLHQTTTNGWNVLQNVTLYIFWFLHQTTTTSAQLQIFNGCISFDSYIKPQPITRTQIRANCCISFDSYIKPQLLHKLYFQFISCISFDSYIKPQHNLKSECLQPVVYLLIPTSNHNQRCWIHNPREVVYLLIPTSNHNKLITFVQPA